MGTTNELPSTNNRNNILKVCYLEEFEDPLKKILKELINTAIPNYTTVKIEISRDDEVLTITYYLRQVVEESTIAAWKLIELEKIIAKRLELDVKTSHTRIGVRNHTLVIHYIFRLRKQNQQT